MEKCQFYHVTNDVIYFFCAKVSQCSPAVIFATKESEEHQSETDFEGENEEGKYYYATPLLHAL
jgi:hypothetical protein